jgi:hypothetical protein
MNIRILPAVPEIGVEAVKDDETPSSEDPVPMRRSAVMLMNLRQTGGEMIPNAIDQMLEWKLDQIGTGKDPPDLAPKRLVHPEIVVGMKESTILQILPKTPELLLGKAYISVTGHVQEGIIKQILRCETYPRLSIGHGSARSLPDRS